MDDKLFVIAIGGTGMRCLESFVHLCAIGMFDGKEINVLTLDTDQSNGNKSRVEQLIELYNKVKRDEGVEGNANAGTFFSAKLNLYKFYTDYGDQGRKTFSLLSAPGAIGLPNADEIEQDDKDLADLFLDKNVQEFNLEHGYRAQTHLGSLLMYHGIIEAMKHVVASKEKAAPHELALAKFVREIVAQNNARVFVFGSVFGGTGASSIPIIPLALEHASAIEGTNVINSSKVKYGSTLLTQYFSFNPPDKNEKAKEKVIATSEHFAINSQAAMQFYQSDPTVRQCYKRLYHIGWPNGMTFSLTDSKNTLTSEKTLTGGGDQKNACHVVELLCACAAYDFFNLDANALNNVDAIYQYRSVEEKDGAFNFTGKTFINDDNNLFANKLGIFFSFAHVVLSLNGGGSRGNYHGTLAFIKHLSRQDCHDYDLLTDEQVEDIDRYMTYFAYDVDASNNFIPGWIYQINTSIGSGKFIFDNQAFEASVRRLEDVNPGKLFTDDKFNWGGRRAKDSYDLLAKTIAEPNCRPIPEKQHLSTMKEKFLAHIYRGIAKEQHFETI